ncbi:hypothetical protein [Flavobacterium orientale]|uniref:Uncharacterized protein n=1 Tax=Flavobacterium orientale TaxID=1756020 RepID=A0A917DCB9_9FLAO|nr:hypothetical protein [Flavobacterium orientale]GGD24665.1 hypothetical protein GCM10011343_13550 [Flavobacterium orientale]
MKKQLILVFAFASLLFSCSSDDTNQDPIDPSVSYLPLTTANSWDYEVNTASQPTLFDDLYVGNDVVISGKTYKQMKNVNMPSGLFCSLMRDNALRQENAKTLFTGTLNFDLGIDIPFDLAVQDLVILDYNAPTNQVLGSLNGVIEETIEGVPFTITYNLKITALENLASYTTPDAVVYNDVKKVQVTLNLQLVTEQTIPGTTITVPVTIMNAQDVVTATQHYAKNIGMVYANDVISYNLAIDPAVVGLAIPQSGNQVITETLTTYNIN